MANNAIFLSCMQSVQFGIDPNMIKTRNIWNRFAPNYEEGFVARFYGQLFRNALIEQMVYLEPVLARGFYCVDAGTAVGNNIPLFLKYGASCVLGLDMSTEMLAINSKKMQASGFGHRVILKEHDLTREKIPVNDGSVGLVANQIVSCYLTAIQRNYCFAEFGRVVRKGGFVLGSGLGPNFRLPAAVQDNQKREGHMDLLRDVVGPLLGEIQYLIKAGEISPASSEEMRQLLEASGFEVVYIDTPPGLENPEDRDDPDYVVRWLGRKL